MTNFLSPPAPTCRSPTTRRPQRRSPRAVAFNSAPNQGILTQVKNSKLLALKSRDEGAQREQQRVQEFSRAKIDQSLLAFEKPVNEGATVVSNTRARVQ